MVESSHASAAGGGDSSDEIGINRVVVEMVSKAVFALVDPLAASIQDAILHEIKVLVKKKESKERRERLNDYDDRARRREIAASAVSVYDDRARRREIAKAAAEVKKIVPGLFSECAAESPPPTTPVASAASAASESSESSAAASAVSAASAATSAAASATV